MLVLNKRASCMRCKALVSSKTEYKCFFGTPVKFILIKGLAFAPIPLKRCYRPYTEEDFNVLKDIMSQKNKKRLLKQYADKFKA